MTATLTRSASARHGSVRWTFGADASREALLEGEAATLEITLTGQQTSTTYVLEPVEGDGLAGP